MINFKVLPISKGLEVLIDESDCEKIDSYSWSATPGSKNGTIWYAATKPSNRPAFLMHRFLLEVTDSKVLVDHRNGNGLDNRRSNLRVCTSSQNGGNSRKSIRNTSGFKGVSFFKHQSRWAAQIAVNRKRIFLGYYETPEQAARVYDVAALKHFGEFAKVNFYD